MANLFRLLGALALFLPAYAGASQFPASLAPLVARVSPAVVAVTSLTQAGNTPAASSDDNSGGDDDSAFHATADNTATDVVPPPKSTEFLGSGFVFDPVGYILTNNHVVDNAASVTVTFPDGTVYPAIVVGRDKSADLAVLKINADHKLPYVSFGDSSKVQVGDWVLAIGNPLGFAGSASSGIVSALHRNIGDTDYDDFIQTDAAINKGNSGGPLFNQQGQVIGVNAAIESPTGASDGIGFAIPAAMAQPVAEQLVQNGEMDRGWLGVASADVTPAIEQLFSLPDTNGAVVGAVSPGSPADGTLHPGDVITELSGIAITNTDSLAIRTAEIPANDTVGLTFWRDGHRHHTDITIASAPAPLDETITAKATAPTTLVLPGYGLSLSTKLADDGGVAITAAHGKATKAGVAAGDNITQLNGQPLTSADALETQLIALAHAHTPATILLNGPTVSGADPGPRWIVLSSLP